MANLSWATKISVLTNNEKKGKSIKTLLSSQQNQKYRES